MRVIAGTQRHTHLFSSDEALMQPTIERVKEAVFSRLHFELPGRRALDLFAGSGQLGLEALSRGAAWCDFVENNRQNAETVRKNVAACKLEAQCRLHVQDAFGFAEAAAAAGEKYDVIFLDPPFHKDLLLQALPAAAALLAPSGVVYCESRIEECPPRQIAGLCVSAEAHYGYIQTTFYRFGPSAAKKESPQ